MCSSVVKACDVRVPWERYHAVTEQHGPRPIVTGRGRGGAPSRDIGYIAKKRFKAPGSQRVRMKFIYTVIIRYHSLCLLRCRSPAQYHALK